MSDASPHSGAVTDDRRCFSGLRTVLFDSQSVLAGVYVQEPLSVAGYHLGGKRGPGRASAVAGEGIRKVSEPRFQGLLSPESV